MPFVCGLFVRHGTVDETLRTRGAAHLLEHLILDPDWAPDVFNGVATAQLTQCWYWGDREEALAMLCHTSGLMRRLPLGRVERERGILQTEAQARGRFMPHVHAGLRYGPHGLGLSDHREFGLTSLRSDDLLALAAKHYVSRNAVAYMLGEPPADFVIELPDGDRVEPPSHRPIPEIEYPSNFGYGPDGYVGISFVVKRTHEQMAALDIAQTRLRDWLRHREGVTYQVAYDYEPLDDEHAHAVVWADCRAHNATLVRNVLITVFDDLAERGPTQEELEASARTMRRYVENPAEIPSHLMYAASQRLFGQEVETPEQLIRDRSAVTADGVAASVQGAWESVLVVAPQSAGGIGGRFRSYPNEAPSVVSGRQFKSVHKDDKTVLVVANDGVSVIGEALRSTARFDDLAAVLRWSDGTIAFWSNDGFYVHVDPEDWKDGDKAASLAARGVSADVLVDFAAPPADHDDPALTEAAAAADAGEFERAVELFEQGLARVPESASGWRGLAWAAAETKRLQAAVDAGRRAAALDHADTWTPRFLTRRLWRAGRQRDALEMLEEALRRGPTELATLAQAADIYVKAGDLAAAERISRRAVEFFPDEAAAWFAYGWHARYAARWDDAERGLRRAAELNPKESMWHNNVGLLMLDLKRPQDALASLETALQLDDENDAATFNKALALHMLGQTDQARRIREERLERRLSEVEKALTRDPGDPMLRGERVSRLGALRRYGDALRGAHDVLEQDETWERWHVLSGLQWMIGDLAGAISSLRSALALEPERSEVADDLAGIAADLGDVELASEAVDAAQGGLRRFQWAEAYAAAARGDWVDAETRFAHITERAPLSCCARAWYGIARLAQGDRAGAEQLRDDARHVTLAECVSIRELETRLAA